MAKMAKPRKPAESNKPSRVEEATSLPYPSAKRLVIVADFPYSRFAKIAAKVPFTQKEWAGILHLSEKTIQRYAKDNRSFEGIYVERILQMEELINLGLETFTSAEAFYSWLKKEKKILGNELNFESLYSSQGIQEIADQVSRIQHGVYT